MKKVFITIIAMFLPLLASAQNYGAVNGIYYIFSSSGKTALVTRPREFYDDEPNDFYSGIIIIPSKVTYKGVTYNVTSIGGEAFFWCNKMTSITIPSSITYIGSKAFFRCSGLTSIKVESGNQYFDSRNNCNAIIETSSNSLIVGCRNTIIPNSVTSIGPNAFDQCSSLTSITIPNEVTSIGEGAFSGCSKLTSITIPNRVTSINNSAFSGCSGLTSITIPNSIVSIGRNAFYNCSGLTSITIPNSVTSIGYDAFRGTAWYNNQSDGLVYAGNVAYKFKGTMPENTSIIINDGTVGISDEAFFDCSGLTSITIPNSVVSIGNYAFQDCSGLTTIMIPKNVTSIGYNVFYGCRSLSSIVVESGNQYYDSRNNCNAIIETSSNSLIVGCKNTIIPNGVTSIGHDAFHSCSGLTSITIPSSVTSIGWHAFNGCTGLSSVFIENGITFVDGLAFSGCNYLTSIVSLNCTPPTCKDNGGGTYPFDSVDKYKCVVGVPRGSANAYKEANGWKDFQNIRELPLGDVNIDFEVNQDDLNATVNYIMRSDQEGFYESLADLNGDEAVDAADVVKFVDILNIQEGLSMDWQANYSNQVVSSLTCTLNNEGNKTIHMTKCELYYNQSIVSSANFKATLAFGESKKCSFDDLATYAAKTGFSVVWHYTYNGESYTYRRDLME